VHEWAIAATRTADTCANLNRWGDVRTEPSCAVFVRNSCALFLGSAKEALTRDLSVELASHGIRVVGLRPQGMPETRTIKDDFEPRAKASGMTWEQWQELLASRTHPRPLMTLEEMAKVAVFMASDQASGMTGTIVNLTMGSVDD
jgi:enoyl-[acyl-carrier-protein] reductase (NADH)